MRRTARLLILLGMALSAASVIHPVRAAMSSPGVAAYARVESSKPVVDVLYRYGHNDAALNGAYGVNVAAPRSGWFLEDQRAGGTDVIAGVIRHEPSLIAEGLKMFHFGLARQAADGSFPGSAWPFHGVAFFLSEAAPALLFLNTSQYAGQFADEVHWQTPRLDRAAHAMVRSVHGAGKIDDTTKNHRFFEAAIALGATGLLTGDRTLQSWSTIYGWKGVHMQWPNGVMPEDGGHDSGYQALGMIDATKYLELIAAGKLRQALYTALRKGEAWELSRIGADGTINQTGDTRTSGCKERNPAGQCKSAFYAPIFSALAHWAAISGDTRFARAAQAVWTRSGYGGH